MATGWVFEKDGEAVMPEVQPWFITNENEGAVAAAVASYGIVSTVSWAYTSELSDGPLVRWLPDWKPKDVAVHAYSPLGCATRSAARALVDFLVADLAGKTLSPTSEDTSGHTY
jgi:DNA-binding transcriptional LysR family regulator